MPCNATARLVTVRTDVAAVHCEQSIAAFPCHTYTGATTGHIACDISAIKCQLGVIFQSDSSTAIHITMCTFANDILCLVVCHISIVHRNCRELSTIEATAGFLRFISGDITATDRYIRTKQCHRTAAGIQRTRSYNTVFFYGTIARKHCRTANRKGTVLHINRAAVATVCAVVEKVAAIQRNTTALCINCATAAIGVRLSRVAENITARYSNVSPLRINGSAKAVGSLAIGGRRIEGSGIFKNTPASYMNSTSAFSGNRTAVTVRCIVINIATVYIDGCRFLGADCGSTPNFINGIAADVSAVNLHCAV